MSLELFGIKVAHMALVFQPLYRWKVRRVVGQRKGKREREKKNCLFESSGKLLVGQVLGALTSGGFLPLEPAEKGSNKVKECARKRD